MIIAPGTEIARVDLQAALFEAPRQMYIGPRIYTPFETPAWMGAFGRVGIADQLARQSVKRTSTGHYPRSTRRISDDDYKTSERGHESQIDDRQSAAYRNFIDFEQAEANALADILARELEFEIMEKCHNTTTFPNSGNTGKDITNEWDDFANATPIDDVRAALDGIRNRGGDPTKVVLQISWRAQYDLSQCDQILQRLKYTSRPSSPISLPELAMALGVSEVIVAGGVYNSADQGLAASIANIWSPEYAFAFIPGRTRDISEPCIGRLMYWQGDGGGTPTEPMIEEYIDNPTRSGILRARNELQVKELFTACGYLLRNCYTA